MTRSAATPKKIDALPVEGGDEEKLTNEIRMAIPLLEGYDIAGKDVTGDALLTQRAKSSEMMPGIEEHTGEYLVL